MYTTWLPHPDLNWQYAFQNERKPIPEIFFSHLWHLLEKKTRGFRSRKGECQGLAVFGVVWPRDDFVLAIDKQLPYFRPCSSGVPRNSVMTSTFLGTPVFKASMAHSPRPSRE